MSEELEVILKRLNLKKELIEQTGKQFEELQSQKDVLPKEAFTQQSKEISKNFKKKLKEIDKIKN